MHIDAVHRRVIMDVSVLQVAIAKILPAAIPERYRDCRFNLRPFLTRLNQATEPLHVYNTLKDDGGVLPGQFRFSGEWLPKNYRERHDHSDIRIHWHAPLKQRRQTLTSDEWEAWRFTYWSYVFHELIHRAQHTLHPNHTARVFRTTTVDSVLQKEQEYLGDYDEIEAYSHNIALEMRFWYPTLSYREAMSEIKKGNAEEGSTYLLYSQAFAGDVNHPALKVLHRKIRVWYNSINDYADFYTALEL